MNARGNRKKTDDILQLQKEISTQFEGLRDEIEKDRTAAHEDRARKMFL